MHLPTHALGMAGALCAALAFAGVAGAADRAGALHVDHAFAPAMPPGARTGAVYLAIENHGTQPDRLLGARSPRAVGVELHSMSEHAGVMRMRAVASIPVPPGQTVRFAPGGLHLMLVDPKPALKEGERVPLTLRFERAGSVNVDVVVESMTAGAGHAH